VNIHLTLRLWIGVLVGFVVIGMAASLFSVMRLGAWAGWVWAGFWCWHELRGRKGVLQRGYFMPFVLLAGLCLLSLSIGLHVFSDSLTYRIPQMLYWLQEGHPAWNNYMDSRVVGMPHVWSYIMAPFFVLLGERALALPSWISLIILWMTLLDWALQFMEAKKARWMALLFTASPVFVLQACSTDNSLFIVALLMSALYFMLRCKLDHNAVVYSALAFSLVCGAKPQYVILAPLYLMWFFKRGDTPARVFRWQAVWWLFPVTVLLSPLPSFAMNWIHGSGISATTMDENYVWNLSVFFWNAVRSLSLLIVQLCAVPFNPFAGQMTDWSRSLIELLGIGPALHMTEIKFSPVLIPDHHVSLGLLSFILLIYGIIRALPRARKELKFLALASLLLMIIPLVLTGPVTPGRSFVGFLALAFPLAMQGVGSIPRKWCAVWGCLALGSAVFVLVVNPHRPLLPMGRMIRMAETHVSSGVYRRLQEYQTFWQRGRVGTALLPNIPEDVRKVGVIIDEGLPCSQLWKPYRLNRTLVFLPPDCTRADVLGAGVQYIIVRHDQLIPIAEQRLSADFLSRLDAVEIARQDCIARLSAGVQAWYLMRVR